MTDPTENRQPVTGPEVEFPPQPDPQPVARPPEPPPKPRLQPINRNQLLLRPVDVEQLVGPDHLVRAIWELVGRLDLSSYTAEVKSVEGEAGRPGL